ncbi:unnamed protein product [Spirodela intermedia]|uniref:Retrovirus-related Pol polyprotein from transposon TNT 1-94-like beta-barrel domain-containing protein n=1 Tax=Spirodela intermedia TaxID=51605 RepID=A0A7I8LIC3_SPIIN|nr:unnamed protein product [Spirodela intermedia]
MATLLQGAMETQIKDGMWYLDTGATNHMTGDRNLFYELTESPGRVVKFGDGSNIDILDKGSILNHKGNSSMYVENYALRILEHSGMQECNLAVTSLKARFKFSNEDKCQ